MYTIYHQSQELSLIYLFACRLSSGCRMRWTSIRTRWIDTYDWFVCMPAAYDPGAEWGEWVLGHDPSWISDSGKSLVARVRRDAQDSGGGGRKFALYIFRHLEGCHGSIRISCVPVSCLFSALRSRRTCMKIHAELMDVYFVCRSSGSKQTGCEPLLALRWKDLDQNTFLRHRSKNFTRKLPIVLMSRYEMLDSCTMTHREFECLALSFQEIQSLLAGWANVTIQIRQVNTSFTTVWERDCLWVSFEESHPIATHEGTMQVKPILVWHKNWWDQHAYILHMKFISNFLSSVFFLAMYKVIGAWRPTCATLRHALEGISVWWWWFIMVTKMLCHCRHRAGIRFPQWDLGLPHSSIHILAIPQHSRPAVQDRVADCFRAEARKVMHKFHWCISSRSNTMILKIKVHAEERISSYSQCLLAMHQDGRPWWLGRIMIACWLKIRTWLYDF